MRTVHISFFAAVGWVLLTNASDARPSKLAYTGVLYVSPDVSSPSIRALPAGTPVHLVRRDKVCSIVSYDGETGYLLSNLLINSPSKYPGIPPWFYPSGNAASLLRRVDPMPAGPYSYYFTGRFGYWGGLR